MDHIRGFTLYFILAANTKNITATMLHTSRWFCPLASSVTTMDVKAIEFHSVTPQGLTLIRVLDISPLQQRNHKG